MCHQKKIVYFHLSKDLETSRFKDYCVVVISKIIVYLSHKIKSPSFRVGIVWSGFI